MTIKCISLIIPVFNEQEAIAPFLERVERVFREKISNVRVEYVFVNDGSTDATLHVLVEAAGRNPNIVVVDLSRNFGKEPALTAGLDVASGDAVVPIDVDLQDPPEIIPALIDRWLAGDEVVVARRVQRREDSALKRETARAFYWVHNLLSKTRIPENVGDFRLMDRVVVDALKRLPESQRFMKGLFAWVGFKTSSVEYVRERRSVGVSKFSGWTLWNLALEGITSFSTAPLRIWTYVGGLVAFVSIVMGCAVVIQKIVFESSTPGYAAVATGIFFLGGVQLIGIGMLGEYIGRVYMETKNRPIYIIRKIEKHQ